MRYSFITYVNSSMKWPNLPHKPSIAYLWQAWFHSHGALNPQIYKTKYTYKSGKLSNQIGGNTSLLFSYIDWMSLYEKYKSGKIN